MEGDAYKAAEAAEAAYAAIAKGDLAGAETQARAALALQPDSTDAVRLVMDVLGRQGKAAEALGIADAAVAKGTVDADLRAARGYLLAAAGRSEAAAADFTAALKDPGLTAGRRAISLALADAAAAAKDNELVLETLAPFAGDMSYDVQARIGFAAFALGRFEQARNAFAAAAGSAPAPDRKTAAFKGQAQAEAALGHGEAAGSIVRTLLGASPACDMDIAYLLIRLGDDATALATFEGRCKDQMTAAAHLDAAYAARRLNRNEIASTHFKAALDADRAAPTPAFDTVTAFGIQRGIDSLDRRFGLSAGAFYRGARSAAGGGSVGQGIVEAYWQPPVIGNRDGKLLQIYGRAGLNALTPASTVQTDSTQGAVGLRYKPFSDLNLLVAGERLFPIGDSAMKDWLVRAGYSMGLNTDIQPAQSSYWTGQIYGEADYFVNQDRFIGTIEGRYGRDSRIGNSPNLLGSLFASAAYSYDAAERSKSATAVGLGAGLRYWFRQTQYRAPSSFIQFDIMYRWKLGPTDRAAGLVLQSSLSF
ncbi:MAG: hypothetical protein IT548_13685 [Alphaproteobacteria bacterium]|nr:hypothetical protein [Alphaproteobacteria bacterium]